MQQQQQPSSSTSMPLWHQATKRPAALVNNIHGNDDNDVNRRESREFQPERNGNRRSRMRRMRRMTSLPPSIMVLIVMTVSGIIISSHRASNDDMPPSTSTSSRYGMRLSTSANSTNEYMMRYEMALLNDDLVRNPGENDDVPFLPLIYDGNSILCRRLHRDAYSKYRIRYFVQMVREGILLEKKRIRRRRRRRGGTDPSVVYDDDDDVGVGVPILVMDGDDNGCNVVRRMDEYNGHVINFPRFAWSTLNTMKHGWDCHALSMPSYETWKYHHRTKRTPRDWESYFANNEREYPWSTKLRMAVWRGSTTYEGHQYHDGELRDMPRGRLVKTGMDNPEIIDASFHKVIQKFSHRRGEVNSEFRTGGRISPRDMMKYRGTRSLSLSLSLSLSRRLFLILCVCFLDFN